VFLLDTVYIGKPWREYLPRCISFSDTHSRSLFPCTPETVQDVAKAIEVPEEEAEVAPVEDVDRVKSPGSSYPSDQVPHETDTTEEPQDDVRAFYSIIFNSFRWFRMCC